MKLASCALKRLVHRVQVCCLVLVQVTVMPFLRTSVLMYPKAKRLQYYRSTTVLLSRYFFMSVGLVAVLLGLIGIALPLLPTTPFMILAAYCFSKSSPFLHQKLLNHKLIGPIIYDWEQRGVIRLKTKWISTITMLALISYPLLFKIQNLPLKLGIMATMICVLCFIWTRPSR